MSESTPPPKQTRERSKAYPGAPLEDCVKFTGIIKKALGRGVHDRESLAKALGFGTVSGAVSPKIAAMVHFGLLDRKLSGYELSSLARSITDPIDDSERLAAIKTAFRSPTLYQEILAKFELDGEIPSRLATHLHRSHGITDGASSQAAEIFVSSGRYASVLDDENRILVENRSSASQMSSPTTSPEETPADPLVIPQPRPTSSPQVSLAPTGHQRFEFAITRGQTVTILVPSDLNAKDIKIIRKQIELLELQANLEDEQN